MKIGKRISIFLALMLLASLAVVGCKKKEEQQPKMAAPQGMMGQQHDFTVVVPDSVKGKWKAVKLSVLDKATQKETESEIAIGSEKTVAGTNLDVKVLNFLPDFSMNIGEHVITSSSNETKKPAAQIMIMQDGKEVYKGWMFYHMQSPHDFKDAKYAVSLAGFVPAGK
jgi:hypothetical protein